MEVIDFFAEYGETHRRMSASPGIFVKKLKDITEFHRKLVERLQLQEALKCTTEVESNINNGAGIFIYPFCFHL